jgi:serine/threonine-protein kinase RsbW
MRLFPNLPNRLPCAMPFEHVQTAPVEGAPLARIVFPGTPCAVREALAALIDGPILASVPDDERGTAELVLAEALNNIVEHAYAQGPGDIEVTIRRVQGDLDCRIVDMGLPMPDDDPPQGRLAVQDPDDLPEGGFGWFLIRTLSRDLHYARVGGSNELTFRLDAGQSAGDGATVSGV